MTSKREEIVNKNKKCKNSNKKGTSVRLTNHKPFKAPTESETVGQIKCVGNIYTYNNANNRKRLLAAKKCEKR